MVYSTCPDIEAGRSGERTVIVEEKYIVVVGGLNMDLAGICGDVYRPHDSNIGEVTMSAGGVGHNIAKNLVKLGIPVYLITAYGDDSFGEILAKECRKDGIRLDDALCVPGGKSCTYLYMTDDKGEMVAAVNAMELIREITPDFLSEKMDRINHASLCIIDANISEESIEYLARNCVVPIFADPVSAAKVGRLESSLPYIDTLKPNSMEAEILTGIRVENENTASLAAHSLRERGAKNVFISMGADGIFCSREGEECLVPIQKTHIVSVNGAGDTTMAAIAWIRFQYGNEISLEKIGRITQAAAAITLESEESVSPYLSEEQILIRMRETGSEE